MPIIVPSEAPQRLRDAIVHLSHDNQNYIFDLYLTLRGIDCLSAIIGECDRVFAQAAEPAAGMFIAADLFLGRRYRKLAHAMDELCDDLRDLENAWKKKSVENMSDPSFVSVIANPPSRSGQDSGASSAMASGPYRTLLLIEFFQITDWLREYDSRIPSRAMIDSFLQGRP